MGLFWRRNRRFRVLEVHFGGNSGCDVFERSAPWRVQFRETIAGQGNRWEEVGYLEGNGLEGFMLRGKTDFSGVAAGAIPEW
jgi:hypothetical protein